MASLGLNIRIPKESLIKLSHHQNQQLVVRFNGGRQIHGKLKSWDKSMNLILDNTSQVVGVDKQEKEEIKREFGLVIVKGSQIESIALKNGFLLIDNPYANGEQANQQEDEQNDEDQNENEDKKQLNHTQLKKESGKQKQSKK